MSPVCSAARPAPGGLEALRRLGRAAPSSRASRGCRAPRARRSSRGAGACPASSTQPAPGFGHARPTLAGRRSELLGRQVADALALGHAVHREQPRLRQQFAQALQVHLRQSAAAALVTMRSADRSWPSMPERPAGWHSVTTPGKTVTRSLRISPPDRKRAERPSDSGGAQPERHQHVIEPVAERRRQRCRSRRPHAARGRSAPSSRRCSYMFRCDSIPLGRPVVPEVWDEAARSRSISSRYADRHRLRPAPASSRRLSCPGFRRRRRIVRKGRCCSASTRHGAKMGLRSRALQRVDEDRPA